MVLRQREADFSQSPFVVSQTSVYTKNTKQKSIKADAA